jgi:hypothetical protein
MRSAVPVHSSAIRTASASHDSRPFRRTLESTERDAALAWEIKFNGKKQREGGEGYRTRRRPNGALLYVSAVSIMKTRYSLN